MPTETETTEIIVPTFQEIFFKGVKYGQKFFFSDDENESIHTKLENLYYLSEDNKKELGKGMAKCVLI